MSIKGMVYVFTGDGKGKTSAALGIVVRALSYGMKAGWVGWYKKRPSSPPAGGLKGLEMHFMGEGFYKLPTDKVTPKKHRQAAAAGLKQAEKLIKKIDVLVLDEVNNAIKDKLVKEKQILELLEKRGKTHVILTGRGASRSVLEGADLVTECKKIKHPFDKGKKAVKGLDY